jgi:HK97 family phage prohead protease
VSADRSSLGVVYVDILGAKYGARNSAQDMQDLQAAHDSLVRAGAQCQQMSDEGGKRVARPMQHVGPRNAPKLSVAVTYVPLNAKAGRRNSSTNQAAIQAAHDAVVQCGAVCRPDMDTKRQVLTAELAVLEAALAAERPRFKSLLTADAAPHAGFDPKAGDRTLIFYAATFDPVPDAVGDVLDPSAFDAWLKVFSNDPKARLPIVIAHRWNDPERSVIGFAGPDDVAVDTRGLVVSAHLLDTDEADRMYELCRRGIVQDASFSYDVLSERRDPKTGVNRILMFGTVHEAGPCLVGVNKFAGEFRVPADTAPTFAMSSELESELHELEMFTRR